jgi:hypothetical protein
VSRTAAEAELIKVSIAAKSRPAAIFHLSGGGVFIVMLGDGFVLRLPEAAQKTLCPAVIPCPFWVLGISSLNPTRITSRQHIPKHGKRTITEIGDGHQGARPVSTS